MNPEFLFEYQFDPSLDAEEVLAQAWDLILALILEEYRSEQEAQNDTGEREC